MAGGESATGRSLAEVLRAGNTKHGTSGEGTKTGTLNWIIPLQCVPYDRSTLGSTFLVHYVAPKRSLLEDFAAFGSPLRWELR